MPEGVTKETPDWGGLGWTDLKLAGRLRGIDIPAKTSLVGAEAVKEAKTKALKELSIWYEAWGETARAPPDFMSSKQLAAEAKELGVKAAPPAKTSARNSLMERIMAEHKSLRDEAIKVAEGKGKEEEEVDTHDATLSHPGGLGIAFSSGRCLSIIPQATADEASGLHSAATPPEIVQLYGTPVLRYTHHLPAAEPSRAHPSDLLLRRWSMVTGLDYTASEIRMVLEITDRSSLERFTMETVDFDTLDNAKDLQEADQMAFRWLTSRIEKGIGSPEDEVSEPEAENESVWIKIPNSKLSLSQGTMDAAAKEHGMAPTDLTLCLASLSDEVTHLVRDTKRSADGDELPKETAPLGSKGNPTFTMYCDMSEDERVSKAKSVDNLLKISYKGAVDGITRKMEPYRQPKEFENLTTGEPMDPKLTAAEMIHEQRTWSCTELHSALSAGTGELTGVQTVNPFCVYCTYGSIQLALELWPELDLTDPKVLEKHMHYMPTANATCCNDCTDKHGKISPVHPNCYKPSNCPYCGVVTSCNGRILMNCNNCRHSFIVPCDPPSDGAPKRKDAKERKTLHEEKLYHYTRILGGLDSMLLGPSLNIEEGRMRMRTVVLASGGMPFDFKLTKRHLLYGPTLQFSEEVSGVGGLCLRDFISMSTASRSDPKILAQCVKAWTAMTEYDTSELIKDIQKKGSSLGKAPPWPQTSDESLEEACLMLAMDNVEIFAQAIGPLFGCDAKSTHKALRKAASGMNADKSAVTEHKHQLSYADRYERSNEACTDFKVDRRHAFEIEAGRVGPTLFYSPTAPKILMQVQMTMERKVREEGAMQAYSKRFNLGGTGLSREAGGNKPDGNVQGNPDEGLATKSHGLINAFESWDHKRLECPRVPTPGILGDRLPDLHALQQRSHLVPRNWEGQLTCLRWIAGCCDAGDLKCPYAHEEADLPIELVRGVLASGGLPKDTTFTLNTMRVWCPKGHLNGKSSESQNVRAAWKNVDRVLEGCTEIHIAKHSHAKVARGESRLEVTQITGNKNLPLKLFSPSGTPLKEVQAITIGSHSSFLEGLRLRTGQKIHLLNGITFDNRCLIVSLAASLSLLPNYIRKPGGSWEVELMRQVNEEILLALQRPDLDLTSRAAEILLLCCAPESHGYNEALLDVIKPSLLRQHNVMLVAEGGIRDPSDRTKTAIRVWPDGNTMREPRESTARSQSYAGKFLSEWDWGFKARAGAFVGVVSTWNEAGTSKHADSFKMASKCSSWSEITEFAETIIEHGSTDMEFRFMSTGQFSTLNKSGTAKGLVNGGVTAAKVKRGILNMEKELKIIRENSVQDTTNPFWRHASLREDLKNQESLEVHEKEEHSVANKLCADAKAQQTSSRDELLHAEKEIKNRLQTTQLKIVTEMVYKLHQNQKPTPGHLRKPSSHKVLYRTSKTSPWRIGTCTEHAPPDLKDSKMTVRPDNGSYAERSLKVDPSLVLPYRFAEDETDTSYLLVKQQAYLDAKQKVNDWAIITEDRPPLESNTAAPADPMQQYEENCGWVDTVFTNVKDDETTRRHDAKLNGDASLKCAVEYMDAVDHICNITDGDEAADLHVILETAGKAAKAWRAVEEATPHDPKLAAAGVHTHGRMFNQLRKLSCGTGRINDGVQIDDWPDAMLITLDEDHCKLLKELLNEGIRTCRVAPRKGYIGQNRDAALEAEVQIMSSYVKHLRQWKCISFITNDEELTNFANEGGIVAPADAVNKLNDRSELRREKPKPGETLGRLKKRPLLDHSDNSGGRRKNKHAKNYGVWSFRFSKQLSTNRQTMAACALEEKALNPGYFLQANKLDYSDAFPTNGIHILDVNEICGVIRNLLIVYGVYSFGGRDAPGVWEILASATSACSWSMEWPDPAKDGDTIPRNCRVVDDTVHFVSRRGNRQQRYLKGFQKLMSVFAGPNSNNTDKEEEAGGFTFEQHIFGSIANTALEIIRTPPSRLCRSEDKILMYLQNKDREFKASEVASARGTLAANLANGPQLDFILSRFDAMSSDMAKKYGERPPDDYEPSPAHTGETEDAARMSFRAELEIAWRFATLSNGKYLYQTFDQVLNPAARDAQGDTEASGKKVFMESDASGDGFFWFDPKTGKYFDLFWNEEEKKAFENWTLLITHAEGAPVVLGLPIQLVDHPKAERHCTRMDNMNFAQAIASHSSRNSINFESVTIIGILTYIFNRNMEELYVNTLHNVRADPGSRLEKTKRAELAKMIKEWEITHQKRTQRIEIPKGWWDSKTWITPQEQMPIDARKEAVFKKIKAMLKWLKQQGADSHARVPLEEAEACIQSMLNNEPIPLLDRTLDDIPALYGPSNERRALILQGKTMHTRTSLIKLLHKNPSAKTPLLRKFKLPGNTEDETLFNHMLQKQSEDRLTLWQDNPSFDPKIARRPVAPVLKVPFKDLKTRFNTSESFGGGMSLSKAFKDAGAGNPRLVAEINPSIREHEKRVLPEATILRSNAELTTARLTEECIEIHLGGPKCQPHSPGNMHGKGVKDILGGGKDYQNSVCEAAAAYDGLGVAAMIIENSAEVLKAKNGMKSAYSELKANCGDYLEGIEAKAVKTREIKSPLTEHIAPLHHERFYAIPLNKWCFPKGTKIKLARHQAPESCAHLLEKDSECMGRFIMPAEDLMDFVFTTPAEGCTVKYAGHIHEPLPGHGESNFPNKGWVAAEGDMVTFTGGGGKWMQHRYNGKTTFTMVNNGDAIRVYGLRDTEQAWWDPRNELGRAIVSHSIVQSVADALAVALSDLYLKKLTPQESREMGFSNRVSPREIFLYLSRGVKTKGVKWMGRPDNQQPPSIHIPKQQSKPVTFIDDKSRKLSATVRSATKSPPTTQGGSFAVPIAWKKISGRKLEAAVLLGFEPARGKSGTWSLPGGTREEGETTHQTCLREVEEEIGKGWDTFIPTKPHYQHYESHFFGAVVPGDLHIPFAPTQTPQEMSEVKWFSLKDIREGAIPELQVRRMVTAVLAKHSWENLLPPLSTGHRSEETRPLSHQGNNCKGDPDTTHIDRKGMTLFDRKRKIRDEENKCVWIPKTAHVKNYDYSKWHLSREEHYRMLKALHQSETRQEQPKLSSSSHSNDKPSGAILKTTPKNPRKFVSYTRQRPANPDDEDELRVRLGSIKTSQGQVRKSDHTPPHLTWECGSCRYHRLMETPHGTFNSMGQCEQCVPTAQASMVGAHGVAVASTPRRPQVAEPSKKPAARSEAEIQSLKRKAARVNALTKARLAKEAVKDAKAAIKEARKINAITRVSNGQAGMEVSDSSSDSSDSSTPFSEDEYLSPEEIEQHMADCFAESLMRLPELPEPAAAGSEMVSDEETVTESPESVEPEDDTDEDYVLHKPANWWQKSTPKNKAKSKALRSKKAPPKATVKQEAKAAVEQALQTSPKSDEETPKKKVKMKEKSPPAEQYPNDMELFGDDSEDEKPTIPMIDLTESDDEDTQLLITYPSSNCCGDPDPTPESLREMLRGWSTSLANSLDTTLKVITSHKDYPGTFADVDTQTLIRWGWAYPSGYLRRGVVSLVDHMCRRLCNRYSLIWAVSNWAIQALHKTHADMMNECYEELLPAVTATPHAMSLGETALQMFCKWWYDFRKPGGLSAAARTALNIEDNIEIYPLGKNLRNLFVNTSSSTYFLLRARKWYSVVEITRDKSRAENSAKPYFLKELGYTIYQLRHDLRRPLSPQLQHTDTAKKVTLVNKKYLSEAMTMEELEWDHIIKGMIKQSFGSSRPPSLYPRTLEELTMRPETHTVNQTRQWGDLIHHPDTPMANATFASFIDDTVVLPGPTRSTAHDHLQFSSEYQTNRIGSFTYPTHHATNHVLSTARTSPFTTHTTDEKDKAMYQSSSGDSSSPGQGYLSAEEFAEYAEFAESFRDHAGNTSGFRDGEDEGKTWSGFTRSKNIDTRRSLLVKKKAPAVKSQSALKSVLSARGKPPPPSRHLRKQYIATEKAEAIIDAKLAQRCDQQKQIRHDRGCRHFVEYYDAKGWETPILDPLDLEQQRRMERYLAYESSVCKIKGHSIEGKIVGVNAAHENAGLMAPFSMSPIASAYLKELKKADPPPLPRFPVCQGVTELFALKNDLRNSRNRQQCTAQSVGRKWCLRSKEYLADDSGKPDERALKWKDVGFRRGRNETLAGANVARANKIQMSVLSSKNASGRCTRTACMVEEDPLDAVKMLIFEYLRVIDITGATPDPERFVFTLEDNSTKVLSRSDVSKSLQTLLESLGVPSFLAGSHSLRRGGASVMAYAGVPDPEIKRWGRWTSDAYKLYIHIAVDTMEKWKSAIAAARPVYENN